MSDGQASPNSPFAGELGLAQVAGRRSGRSLLGLCAVQPARKSRVHGFCTTPPAVTTKPLASTSGGFPLVDASVVLIEPGSVGWGQVLEALAQPTDDVQINKSLAGFSSCD